MIEATFSLQMVLNSNWWKPTASNCIVFSTVSCNMETQVFEKHCVFNVFVGGLAGSGPEKYWFFYVLCDAVFKKYCFFNIFAGGWQASGPEKYWFFNVFCNAMLKKYCFFNVFVASGPEMYWFFNVFCEAVLKKYCFFNIKWSA